MAGAVEDAEPTAPSAKAGAAAGRAARPRHHSCRVAAPAPADKGKGKAEAPAAPANKGKGKAEALQCLSDPILRMSLAKAESTVTVGWRS